MRDLITRTLREIFGVGSWPLDSDADDVNNVPTAYQQLADAPNFFGRSASHNLGKLYQVWSDWRPILVIANHAYAAEFNKNQMQHTRKPDLGAGYVFESLIGSAIGAAFGSEWTRHKAHFKTQFGMPIAEARTDIVKEELQHFMSRLRYFAATSTAFQVEDVELHRLTLRVLSAVCYGRTFAQSNMHHIETIVQMHDRVMMGAGDKATRWPCYRILPTHLNRQLNEFWSTWKSFNRTAWSSVPPGDDSVVGHLKQLEQSGTLRLSEVEVHQNLEEILLLNIDVMFAAVGSLLMHLAIYTSWQDRLRSEIDDKVGLVQAQAFDFGSAELKGLADMDNFILESARLCPALALTLPEEIPCDMSIGAAAIPAGTSVMIDTFSINHDPAVFDSPDDFDPDRFQRNPSLRHRMFRFGMGPRKCMGQNYATIIIKTLLVRMISEQRLQLGDKYDARPHLVRIVNASGEKLSYREPCKEVRQAGSCFFTPYLVFPKLLSVGVPRTVPLTSQPLYCDAALLVAKHWHSRLDAGYIWNIKSTQHEPRNGSRCELGGA